MKAAVVRRLLIGLLGVLPIAGESVAAGEIIRCVDAGGNVTFRDSGCPDTAVEQPQGHRDEPSGAAAQTGAAPPDAAKGKRQGYGAYIDRSRAAEQEAPPPNGQ